MEVFPSTLKPGATRDEVLRSVLPRMSDGSLKVGIQGLDANRWRIGEILYVLEAYAAYAEIAEETLGIRVPPIDVWGGGQVSQIPRFLGEDPYLNLSRLSSIAKNMRLKCIYRGRQGFGFLPCADEIQQIAISEAVTRGINVFRTFDPMNDWRNLTTCIEQINAIRKKQITMHTPPDKTVSAEGLIFYVRPPKDREAVFDISSMCNYAIKLCEIGFHEVAVADYANQITSPEQAQEIVSSVRKALNEASFSEVPLNFFAQGCGAEIVQVALNTGAATADVSIGKLSGKLSNPDMFEILNLYLVEAKCEPCFRRKNEHPTLIALAEINRRIDIASSRHLPYRIPEKKLNTKLTSSSRLAFNAIAALHSAIDKNWDRLLEKNTKSSYGNVSTTERKDRYFRDVLDETKRLWIRGGQFNLVSPMGFFCSFQAEQLVRFRAAGMELIPSHFTFEYRDLLKGRYGENIGIERSQGDVVLANTFHLLEFFAIILKYRAYDVEEIINCLGLAKIMTKSADDSEKLCIRTLESDTRSFEILGNLDTDLLRQKLIQINIDDDLRKKLLFSLSKDRFPPPTEGIAEGRKVISEIINMEAEIKSIEKTEHMLSERDRLALYAVLFKVREVDPYCVTRTLIATRAARTGSAIGDVEEDIRPYDRMFKDEIAILGVLTAKRVVLKKYLWFFRYSAAKSATTKAALTNLNSKIQNIVELTKERILKLTGSINDTPYWLDSKHAFRILNSLIEREMRANIPNLTVTAPGLWLITETENVYSKGVMENDWIFK